LPACLSAHPSLSIPDLGVFQLQLTPFNSTPTDAFQLQTDGGPREEAEEEEEEEEEEAAPSEPETLPSQKPGWRAPRDIYLLLRTYFQSRKGGLKAAVLDMDKVRSSHTGPHTAASAW
jgi:hypothetical protein